MRRHFSLMALAIAVAVVAPIALTSQPKESKKLVAKRFATEEEVRKLRSEYRSIKREIKRRKFVETIQKQDRDVNWSYIEKRYGIRQLPPEEYRNVRLVELERLLHELEGKIGRLEMRYGPDDTKNIYLTPPEQPNPTIRFVTDPDVLHVAHSVVAIVDTGAMTFQNNKWSLETEPLTDLGGFPLCTFEVTYGEPVADVRGTGFLVGDDIIATAGHVVSWPHDDFLNEVYFVFEWVYETEGVAKTIFAPNEVYKGTEVIADHDEVGTDWALIRLDREVTGRDPLPYRTESKVGDDARLYMIGHPNGGPQKYSGEAGIKENTACNHFLSKLDSYPYNSGSPVFNAASDTVEGILFSDVAAFEEYPCECFAIAVWKPQHGFPGAGVVRSTVLAGLLQLPGSVIVRCDVEEAVIMTAQGMLPLEDDQEIEIPYGDIEDLGIQLLQNIVNCPVYYYPHPGEEWEIVDLQTTMAEVESELVIMQKVCFP
jgi:V8-like Glu-specific endopeptidase